MNLILPRLLSPIAFCALFVVLAGCGQKAEAPAVDKEAVETVEEAPAAGLDGDVEISTAEAPVAVEMSEEVARDEESGEHHHDAPHGGILVELGDHFANVELVLDTEAGKLTLYAFDAHAESPVRLTQQSIPFKLALPDDAQEYELTLAATVNPLTGETLGDTSEFSVLHDLLRGNDSIKIVIPTLVVNEQNFSDVSAEL